jgi:hypothetical protein
VSDFQRESYRIDEQIWAALALRTGERALFLGTANDGAWIARAVEIGVAVTVVVTSAAAIELVEKAGATAMRGSATMIPATANAYDVAVAIHYLHEIDPGFHTDVVGELARVAKRVAIVEPSPPADALGKRIAALYARAKRDTGQFEGYQPIEYWRKLLAAAKADVYQNLVTFTRVPPKEAVAETVSLILDAMAIEEMPKEYLDELRGLAAHRDAQLLPLSRIVLVGTAAGEPIPQGSGAAFRPNVTPAPPPQAVQAAPPAFAAPPPAPARAPVEPYSPAAPQAPVPAPGFGFKPDLPPLPWDPPSPDPRIPPAPEVSGTPGPPGAAPVGPPAAAPFGAPFALPEDSGDEAPFGGGAEPRTGFGWAWEPPEDEPPPQP